MSYVIYSDNVVERVNFGCTYNDPDALLAKTWVEEYFHEFGNYSGIDGRLRRKFNEICRPGAVKKFVNLK